MEGELKAMRVLALTKYGTLAASTRQRFLQYEPHLRAAGIELHVSPLLDNDYLAPLLRGHETSLPPILRGYWQRFLQLWNARQYDLLWVHCEYFPYLPGWVEIASSKLGGKPIVYDYDDAIFHIYDRNRSPLIRTMLAGKLEPLLRRVSACLCGNAYLRDYAAQFCDDCIILPTVVDTDAYRPAARKSGAQPIVIGWIGSPSTWENVQPLLPLLEQVCREQGTIVRAIGAGSAAKADMFPGLELIEWNESSEARDLAGLDIGIMPLLDLPFQRGKSGYKLIQYMACGLPVIASPIGVNEEIVRDGSNGFLADDLEQWRSALLRLIEDSELRETLGRAGREIAEHDYSLKAHAPRLIEVLQRAATKRGT
jgi:hypothetical protein